MSQNSQEWPGLWLDTPARVQRPVVFAGCGKSSSLANVTKQIAKHCVLMGQLSPEIRVMLRLETSKPMLGDCSDGESPRYCFRGQWTIHPLPKSPPGGEQGRPAAQPGSQPRPLPCSAEPENAHWGRCGSYSSCRPPRWPSGTLNRAGLSFWGLG